MAEQKDKARDHVLEDSPPVFRSWRTWYAVVLINLATLVALFYAITRLFQ